MRRGAAAASRIKGEEKAVHGGKGTTKTPKITGLAFYPANKPGNFAGSGWFGCLKFPARLSLEATPYNAHPLQRFPSAISPFHLCSRGIFISSQTDTLSLFSAFPFEYFFDRLEPLIARG